MGILWLSYTTMIRWIHSQFRNTEKLWVESSYQTIFSIWHCLVKRQKLQKFRGNILQAVHIEKTAFTRFLAFSVRRLHFSVLSSGERERHVLKEGYGCTLLCIGCNERHNCTFGQSIDPKERHVLTDWLFSVHKITSKFGYDPKERYDYTLII